MRYFIDIIDKDFLASNSTNAASKPRTDTMHTAIRCGYKPVILNCYWRFDGMPHSIKEKIQKKAYWTYMRWQMRKLKSIKDSEIFMQYPFLSPRMMEGMKMLKSNGNKLTILFHDFYTLREGRTNDVIEKWLLKNIDVAIVHTMPMEEAFRKAGYKGEIRLLHYFDYISNTPASPRNFSGINIIYAGNLEKCGFVKQLPLLQKHDNMQFFLYGNPQIQSKDAVIYKGCFDSEDIEGVEGNWGLVWDGDATDTCSGSFGEYLRYNAPFKFSLYLALGIPVIVWSESAMAKYVKEHNLGICINSLSEIQSTISMLEPVKEEQIKLSVKMMQTKIKEGEMLKRALLG